MLTVQRGSSVIPSGQTALPLTNGVDYTVTGDDWFVQIANNHFTGMGRTASGSNQNLDDVSVRVSHSGSDTTFTRVGSANDCRVD